MKKVLTVAFAALLAIGSNAQECEKQGGNQCADRFEQAAARLAADFGLNEAQTASFTTLYVEYRQALKAASADKGCKKGKHGKKAKCNRQQNCGQQHNCNRQQQCKRDEACQKKDSCLQRGGQCQMTLTDEQAKEMLKAKLECEKAKAEAATKRAEIDKKYADKFLKVLTPQQTLKVMKARHHRGHGMQRGRHPQRAMRLHHAKAQRAMHPDCRR